MKNALTYICSIIISVILVFTVILSVFGVVGKIHVSEERFTSLAVENDVPEKVYSELEKYFSSRSSATSIPASVYMDAIDEEYLKDIIDRIIHNGFAMLNSENTEDMIIYNEKLSGSIENFFNSYAEETGCKKDDKFDQKLEDTKTSAYNVIVDQCDIYKFNALEKHGVLSKLAFFYSKLDIALLICVGACFALTILLTLLNSGTKAGGMFWIGISLAISGIIIIVPCSYFIVSDYFSAFTIKQPQIYTAYTSTLNALNKAMFSTSICIMTIGLCLTIIYRVLACENPDVKPAKVD